MTIDAIDAEAAAAAEAYRQLLLTALGDDDPAEVQAQTPDLVQALIVEAGGLLRVAPEPSEWSVLECVAHIVDAELIISTRYRWIIAEDEPPIIGYDQALWVAKLAQVDDDPALLVEVFRALRRWNIELWRRRPIEDRERIGRHSERGPESYGMTFKLAAGHDRIHLAQARRALEAARAASGS